MNNSRSRYVGPPILRLSDFLKALCGVKRIDSWFWEAQFYLAHKGRTAIRYAVELLGLKPGTEILVPSYNCGSEIDPLVKGGLKIVPYRINKEAQIDMDDLLSRINLRTKAIYVTHYFGFPQPINEIKDLCEEKGLYLIEDCALSLFSSHSGRKLGTWGDVAVFSLTKTLPLPDGGILAVNNPNLRRSNWNMKAPPFGNTLKGLMGNLKSIILRSLSRGGISYPAYIFIHDRLIHKKAMQGLFNELAMEKPDLRPDMYFNGRVKDLGISFLAEKLIFCFDPNEIIKKRRSNYSCLRSLLKKIQEIKILFPFLPEGVCPLGLPILVHDRNMLFETLYRQGIVSFAFWRGFHPAIDWDLFPEATFLKKHILLLPVHQDLEEKDMEEIAEAISASMKFRHHSKSPLCGPRN